MFKGIHQFATKMRSPDAPHGHAVYAIQQAPALLATQNCQQHLKNMKALLNLPPKLFDKIYQQPIAHFAELVQTLPQTRHGLFANSGAFLEHGIERAARALALCLTYFFPQEKTLQMASSQEALWIYAVFTAALFLDIGKLAVKYQITLCHKDGNPIRDWLPYTGSMMEQGYFYTYDFVKENRDHLGWMVTPLLARQILDAASMEMDDNESTQAAGFNWIATDPTVLEAWLRMLTGDQRGATSFMTVIPLADTQIIERYLNAKSGGAVQPSGLFPNTILDSRHILGSGEENVQAETVKNFLEWLAKNQDKKEISDLIHKEHEGVFLSSEIFEAFVSANARYSNAGTVEQQFRELLATQITSVGDLVKKYSYLQGTLAGQKRTEWLLFTNPGLLNLGAAPTDVLNASRTAIAERAALTNHVYEGPITTRPNIPTAKPS